MKICVFLYIKNTRYGNDRFDISRYNATGYTSREILLEILQKRQVEARRSEISKTAKQSLKDYHSGKNNPLSAEEAIVKLNNL